MPYFQNRTPRIAPSARITLAHRRCDVSDLDYSLVTKGRITCRVCNNQWRLRVSADKAGTKYYHWVPNICPGCQKASNLCDHYKVKAKNPLVFPDADEDSHYSDDDIW